MRRAVRGASTFTLALLMARSAAAADWSPEAQRYYQRGVVLLEQRSPDYEAAYRNFRLAYDLTSDWRMLESLGHCAEALERDGEAIQALEQYLLRGGAEIADEDRSAAERALRSLKANVGQVLITSSVPDLMLVDTRVDSAVPPQVYRLENGRLELGLRAGRHLLTATVRGQTAEWQVELAPGMSVQHRFDFARRGQPSPLSPVKADEEQSSDFARTIALGGAGVASAALVGGVVTGLLALAQEDDARALCRKEARGGTECPESARDEFDRARTFATVTNVLLVSGGILAAASIGTLVFSTTASSSPRANTSGAIRVQPELGLASTALTISGWF